MIDFGLQEENQLIVASLKDFARAELRECLRKTEQEGVSAELQRKYHEMGLAGIAYPQRLGGQGLGPVTNVLAEEELSWGDPGATVALDGLGLFGRALLSLGSEEQQQRWLAPLMRAEGIGHSGAFAWSEPGTQTPGLATAARRDGAQWVVQGKKTGVIHGDCCDAVVVFAQVEPERGWNGLGAFVVGSGNPGVRASERLTLLGLEAVPVVDLTFEACRLDAGARLEAAGDEFLPALRGVFAHAALIAAARMVGLSRAAYEYALVYAEERKAFGKPIAHFQALAFMLAEMAMDVNAARWLTWQAAWRTEQKGVERAHRHIASAFGQAGEVAKRVSDQCVQILGGAGYVKDHPAEKWMRDASTLALMAGSAEQANAVVMAELLGNEADVPPADLLPAAEIQAVLT